MASSTPQTKQKKKMKKEKSYSLQDLKTLGHQLLSSRSHINNAPILLSFISPSSPREHALESLLSLQSFFVPLLSDLPPSSSKAFASAKKDDPESVYRAWLRSKFDQFVNSLIDLSICSESEEALRDVSLDAIMEFVKLGKGGTFQSATYHKLLRSMVYSTSSDDFLLDLLVLKFFNYMDICYFTYISLEKLSRNFEATNIADNKNVRSNDDGEHVSGSSSAELAIHKMYNILSRIPPLEGEDGKPNHEMWSQLGFSSKKADHKTSFGSLLVEDGAEKLKCNSEVLPTSYVTKKMKLKFTKAWISFLRLPLPLDVYKEVLVSLHQMVIPYMANPAILCDFLTRSYDIGGVTSVMALSSLFILMTQHGLEYPNFYEKLYALLVPAVFMAKHRARFFQLLDSCLKSSLLPAYLAAAFAKKLSRLALSVPPSGALVIIAIIHNLLRRHPSINCLVHQVIERANRANSDARESDGAPNMFTRKPGVDLFNNEENDPAKSNAMRSSLWEIDTLRHHYCPAVSRFVASLENDLTVRAKTSEITVNDFSSGSYATIFREEIRRRIKQVPLAFYKATPTSLFSESDFSGWTFGLGQSDKENAGTNRTSETYTCEEDDYKSPKRKRIECS
ncbi:protein NUCLEOLAR COMPLEX ASSOCIATED 4 [Magnolia sinica]|uniref:protein NUCLEOLAR COMPLEX ASSOCIATED 4 n=1 Tax=Magnolia sinica TaxID=86752 RepID=UPI00265870C6|nr:protein NUCLEOLAR COMPLEX ASSOCIATED 4 [Magnolia sinica]